jgi:AMMECR1 domain-containing protein
METKQEIKIYRNGKTYEENVRSGVFLPKKALDNHKEVMTEIADLKAIVMKLLNNMDR